MSQSHHASTTHRKGLAKALPVLADLAEHSRAEACLETAEILMDVDQVTTLLSSLDDLRKGRIISMQDAFGDL